MLANMTTALTELDVSETSESAMAYEINANLLVLLYVDNKEMCMRYFG